MMRKPPIVIGTLCLTAWFIPVPAQTTKPAASGRDTELAEARQEVERLRSDVDRLRKERDAYRQEVESAQARVSADLKVLSAALSKEIKEDFYGSLTRLLWIMATLIGVATVGGYLKLSDIISSRISEKVDEREKDFQQLRGDVLMALVEFRTQAAEAIADVSERRRTVRQESEAALTEIRSRALEVSYTIDATGNQSAVLARSGVTTTSTESTAIALPGGVTRVSASHTRMAYETSIDGRYVGVFSHYFLEALRDPLADSNGDGRVSLKEAVAAARSSIKKAGFDQDPSIFGDDVSLALFSLTRVAKAQRPDGRVLAVLVGINDYAEQAIRLRGPVNDVKAFERLLHDRAHLLASEAVVRLRIDAQATRDNITQELDWLRQNSTGSDIALFFYSGHSTTVVDETRGNEEISVIVPCDVNLKGGNFIKVPDLLEALSKIEARARVFITA